MLQVSDTPLPKAEALGAEAHLPGLDLGHVQDVGQHLLEQLGRGDHQFGHLAVLVAALALGQQVRQGHHPVERGAQLVAHIGQEGGLGPVRPVQLAGALGHPILEGLQDLVRPQSLLG